jgi:ribosome biogenesis SPOUT family RNA methylase Rps3
MGSSVEVARVKLKLQNLEEEHREPLAKLGVEGIKESADRALANRWQVVVVRKQSRAGVMARETKWSRGAMPVRPHAG